jgi:hypothetical protein
MGKKIENRKISPRHDIVMYLTSNTCKNFNLYIFNTHFTNYHRGPKKKEN